MLGHWDTAVTSGLIGCLLFAIFCVASAHQLWVYLRIQMAANTFNPWENKFLFLACITLWALLDALYNIGLIVDDEISSWAYSCHAIALTAVLVAFCQVILFWSKALSFRGQYKRARSIIRKVVAVNIALVVLTIIMLAVSGSYDQFASEHPQFNAVFQIEEGGCMLLLSAWMLWYGLYLQRRFMSATTGASVQDPTGLARVTISQRYTRNDLNSELESGDTGVTESHSEVENEVDNEVSDPLLSAKIYEEKLLGATDTSDDDANSYHRQNTYMTYETGNTSHSKIANESYNTDSSPNFNWSTTSRLSVIVRINGVLTSCCVCFFLRVVLLLLAAVDSLFNKTITDHMLWVTWFLLSTWIPLLVPGCILLYVMRPTESRPLETSNLSQSFLLSYSDLNRESLYGHALLCSSSGTGSSRKSEDAYEISDYGESASLSTVSVSTADNHRYHSEDRPSGGDDAYIPPDFSSSGRRSEKASSGYGLYSEI